MQYRNACDAVFVQRVSEEPRREPQGGGTVCGRVACQEADSVPLLLRHDVTKHGHRREDVQHRRRRAQVSASHPFTSRTVAFAARTDAAYMVECKPRVVTVLLNDDDAP